MEKTIYEILGQEIFDKVGGSGNVEKLIHCMTRVRMTIRDYSKVDIDGLKKIEGVLGVVEEETLQVVIGPGKVNKVAQTMVDSVGVKLGDPFPKGTQTLDEIAQQNKAQAKNKYNKPSKFKNVMKSISNIFVPMIPAFVGAGLIGGIAAVMGNMIVAKQLDAATFQQFVDVMNIIKNGIFAYLAIYVGINSAQEFGATPALGGVVGAVTLLSGMNPEMPLHNIFTGLPLSSGQGGIIGVIFAVWILSIIEKGLRKVVPDSIDIIVTPTLSLLGVGLITIFLIMPIAGAISSGLVGAINTTLRVGGVFSGFALGTLFLPMVMFGLHQILTPIHIEMIAKTGSTQLLPILAMAGAGQVGAAIALRVRLRKNKELSNMIKGALPVGILGIGEPLIYGVTLPMVRPFVTACIAGGIGGGVLGAFGNVGAIAIGPSGVALLPLIAENKWWMYAIGLLAAYISGFVITLAFGIPKEEKEKADNYMADHSETAKLVVKETLKRENVECNQVIKAPVSGELIPLSEMKDQAFASGMLGKGVAIRPDSGDFISPVDGIISVMFPSKHAFGITSDEGVEILIHIGMDTVTLDSRGFESKLKQGDRVKTGDKLVTVDLELIKEAGLEIITPIVVTNSADISIVEPVNKLAVNAGDDLIICK
ncbi:glucose PTS transporter subunit IIA [Dellaglioa algida]|uniref:glucose PTS transporter subunit IIA n=1 Tax=Dellaglioa algida TaxID=105612 RepID=UPI0024C483E5|nr:glucose PTS transporter subunit IIA [Dellaglioa algida]MDK1728560.1 glucose PTS transporter subunit IIA [Dellaglioa algida]MDK1736192.1 glucose PTS transporter subunit IIA [Dellaglioa algida]MDK1737961.1 glucose PTS transporter subunit IIA [Dellaglioa algida]